MSLVSVQTPTSSTWTADISRLWEGGTVRVTATSGAETASLDVVVPAQPGLKLRDAATGRLVALLDATTGAYLPIFAVANVQRADAQGSVALRGAAQSAAPGSAVLQLLWTQTAPGSVALRGTQAAAVPGSATLRAPALTASATGAAVLQGKAASTAPGSATLLLTTSATAPGGATLSVISPSSALSLGSAALRGEVVETASGSAAIQDTLSTSSDGSSVLAIRSAVSVGAGAVLATAGRADVAGSAVLGGDLRASVPGSACVTISSTQLDAAVVEFMAEPAAVSLAAEPLAVDLIASPVPVEEVIPMIDGFKVKVPAGTNATRILTFYSDDGTTPRNVSETDVSFVVYSSPTTVAFTVACPNGESAHEKVLQFTKEQIPAVKTYKARVLIDAGGEEGPEDAATGTLVAH